MEAAVRGAQEDPEWPACIPAIPELQVQEILYMDDSLVWSGSKGATQKKYDILRKHLAQWGLSLNTTKTKYYAGKHCTESGPIILEGNYIQPSKTLEVFGIPLEVPLKPTKLMDTAMTRAQAKFHAHREVFLSRGPLCKKLKVFQSVVGGAGLWYCAAVNPTAQALGALNACQLELVAKLAKIKRKPQETWLDHRLRSHRTARALLHNHGHERWSTIWLRRNWGYRGHVSRAYDRTSPPASSLLQRCRDNAWWTEQRANPHGITHRGTFYPYLNNDETKVIRACGNHKWHEEAKDKIRWHTFLPEWLKREDVAWCSGRQVALCN